KCHCVHGKPGKGIRGVACCVTCAYLTTSQILLSHTHKISLLGFTDTRHTPWSGKHRDTHTHTLTHAHTLEWESYRRVCSHSTVTKNTKRFCRERVEIGFF